MKRPKPSTQKSSYTKQDFYDEAEYADSILRSALGDHEGSIAALRRSLECKPTYAPAILSLGSVEYQLGKRAEGQELFRSLLSLPKNTPDLCEIIDEAGSFLINIGAYKDGLDLGWCLLEAPHPAGPPHPGAGGLHGSVQRIGA